MATKTVAKKATTKKGPTKTVQKSTKRLAVTMKTAKKSKKIMEVPAFFPKYPEYRLSDVLSCKWSRHMNVGKVKRLEEYVSHEKETLKEYTLRLFPNSIASQYLSKTKRLNDTRVLSTIVDKSRRAAAGRAELLAKWQHTDRLQNLAKLRRFRKGGRIGGGIGGRIIRNFRKMLHFGKIPKKFGQIWRKFSKILAKFANFWEKSRKKQQFLTKILRLENGAKECIV